MFFIFKLFFSTNFFITFADLLKGIFSFKKSLIILTLWLPLKLSLGSFIFFSNLSIISLTDRLPIILLKSIFFILNFLNIDKTIDKTKYLGDYLELIISHPM